MASEELYFAVDGDGGEEAEDGETPCDLCDGVLGLACFFAVVYEDRLPIFLISGQAKEDIAEGVGDGEQVALIVVLLVQDNALVAVTVVEEGFYD